MKKRMNEGKRLLKLMIIIGLILGSFELQAQSVVIKPVDLQSKIVVGVSGDESGLYQAYIVRRNVDKRIVLYLSYYNQFFWSLKKAILLDSSASVRGIAIGPDKSVVIYGRFTYQIAPAVTQYKNILIYKNGNWLASARFNQFKDESLVNTVAWKKDTLLFGGIFDSLAKTRFMNIGKFHEHIFYPITNVNDMPGVNGAVSQIAYQNDKLFVSGNFGTAAGKAVKGFTYMKNGEWNLVTKPFLKADKFTFLGNDVIIHSSSSNDQFFRIDIAANKTTDYSLGISKINRLNQLISYNNTIHAVGDFELAIGNIKTGWIAYNTFWNTINLAQDCKFIDSTRHGLYIVGKHLLGPYPISQTPFQYMGRYKPAEKLIYGNLYLDLNTNCAYDSGVDIPVRKRSIRFGSDRAAVFTDDLSRFYYYYQKTENKMPNVLMDNRAFKYSLCVQDSNDIKMPTKSVIPKAIAISPIGINKAKLDTRIIVHSGQRIRKAGKNAMTYLITNIGLAEASRIKVTLNGTTKMKDLITLTPKKHEVTDTTITWNLPNLKPLETTFITVVYGIQDNADVVNNKLEFEIDHEYNNQVEVETGEDFFSQLITNEDQAALKEQGLPGQPQGELASIAATDTIIEYQITFQNRTNDIVNEVVVIDTLDLRYNFLYTQTIASSHPFTNTIEQDPVDPNIGYLIYTFSGLNLAANAAANPEIINDEGYIKFKSVFDRKHGLNDQIKNTAIVIMNDEHYFPTNAVVCSVDRLVSTPTIVKKGSLSVYPNPTSRDLHLVMANQKEFSYRIIDLRGALIQSKEGYMDHTIDVNRLNQGVYILQIEQNGQIWTQKFIKE